jgi:hypothetical protein
MGLEEESRKSQGWRVCDLLVGGEESRADVSTGERGWWFWLTLRGWWWW